MSKISNTEEFIKKAISIFNNQYDYSKVNYINAHVKVKIICKIHKIFLLTPNKHISRKSGCPKCGILKRNNLKKDTLSDFIYKANLVHNNKYCYKLTIYKSSKNKIKIKCNTHGIFKQMPCKHLFGDGCPLCGNLKISKKASENPKGWTLSNWIKASEKSTNFDSFKVYIIKCWNENEEFYKIGRTFLSVKNRFKNNIFYNYKILNEFIGTAEKMYNLETNLKRLNKENKYIPLIKFNGMQECFKEIKLIKTNK
jgi:hypothetical protein